MKTEKLKTLNDFENKRIINGEEITNYICAETLKAEAVKWCGEYNDAFTDIFKEFFNITDEDLKKEMKNETKM